jgi:hypothetical protein
LRNGGPALEEVKVPLGPGRWGTLVRRSARSLSRWLTSWWRKAPAPEVRQAALLFRLQRYGVLAPRLLAFGQRRNHIWRQDSFLLTETPPLTGSLGELLKPTTLPSRRGTLLRRAGELVRRLHDAGLHVGGLGEDFAGRCAVSEEGLLFLTRIDGLTRAAQQGPALAALDFRRLSAGRLRKTDEVRFMLGYLGITRLREGRAFLQSLRARRRGLAW